MNKHIILALDNYPYNMEECWESLQYAISSDSQNAMSLVLMGRIYAEQFYQYPEAISYFKEAMQEDMNLIEIYPYYIETLIKNEDYAEAEKLIEFAFTIKGINKVEIYISKIQILEIKGEYKEAQKLIKQGILSTQSDCWISDLEKIEKRLKKKRKLLEGKEKKTKDKEKEKKKKKNK